MATTTLNYVSTSTITYDFEDGYYTTVIVCGDNSTVGTLMCRVVRTPITPDEFFAALGFKAD